MVLRREHYLRRRRPPDSRARPAAATALAGREEDGRGLGPRLGEGSAEGGIDAVCELLRPLGLGGGVAAVAGEGRGTGARSERDT